MAIFFYHRSPKIATASTAWIDVYSGRNDVVICTINKFKMACFNITFFSQVVKVTKVKHVESESLKKKYESSQSELAKMREVFDTQKQELHEAQNQIRYLERMVGIQYLVFLSSYCQSLTNHLVVGGVIF